MYHITSFTANAVSVRWLPIPKLLPLLHPPSSPYTLHTGCQQASLAPIPVPSVTLHNTMP